MSDFAPERAMTEEERELAESVYAAIQRSSNFSERSQQSADFRIGISDLGWCSEKVRRMVAGIPEPPTDKLPAFAGTALGDHIERACLAAWPHALVQQDVAVTLHGDGGDYRVGGHPDMVLPEGKLIDFKTARGLGKARRSGPDQQQQFQRHCYALGAWEAGLFHDSVKGPEEVQVANVWMDRSCDERELWVDMEPFSWDVIDQAAMWVDDLVYSYRHDLEARKEPAIEVCRKTCGHFEDCRASEGSVEGLLTDDNVLIAVDMYREASDMEKRARKLKDEARAELAGVQGSTGKFAIRWVRVNGGHVEYDRQPYDKLDVRKA